MAKLTSLYEAKAPHNHFGSSVQFNAVGSPAGTSMSPQLLELLRMMVEQLNLASIGISTPWATRISDLNWQEIHNPDTNIQTFIIRDVDILQAQQLMFGQPLPFLVLKTLNPIPRATVEAALVGSPYEFYETQAVYRQDDPNPIPRIEFHHWVRRRPLDQEGSKPMSKVAESINGDLLFGQQVPVEGTTLREKPSIGFQQAFDAQFWADEWVSQAPAPAPVPVPAPAPPTVQVDPTTEPTTVPIPESEPDPLILEEQAAEEDSDFLPEDRSPTPSSPAKVPFWGPVLVAGVVALGAIVILKGVKK